jgi:hypothetical protein
MTTGNRPDPDKASARTKNMPRSGHGRFVRTTETAKRDAEAAELRSKGWTYRRIATHFNVDTHTAHDMVSRAILAIVQEPAEEVRRLELARLDEMYQAAMGVLERHHVTVSNGRVVKLGDDPIPDDGPALQAIDRLLKIQERRARLLGLDAPSRVSVEAETLGREIGRLLDAALTPDTEDDHTDNADS